MLIAEYNYDEDIQVQREEAMEKGIEKADDHTGSRPGRFVRTGFHQKNAPEHVSQGRRLLSLV